MQGGRKAVWSIPYVSVAFFPSLKHNFIAYRSSSRPDCIFEIHQQYTLYLTKMGIKTVPHAPYSPNLAPCDFRLFPKLTVCRYERIKEMKEAVMKVTDTLTQEDFHGALQKLLERYNKCIAAGGDYFEGD